MEDAEREDIPMGTTSQVPGEIEAFVKRLFDTDARAEVTDGFVGAAWAVVGWSFSATRQETRGEVTLRGASVSELQDGQISRQTVYYDLPELQQQIAAAGGLPGPLETLAS